MIALVFLALLSIASVAGSASHLEKSLSPSALTMLSTSTEYVVDDILELLNSFANTVHEQLEDLDAHLDRELKSLETLIKKKSDRLLSHTPACHHLAIDAEFRQRELERVSEFVSWVTKRVNANNELIQRLYDERCITHMMYIDFLQNSQYFLRLVQVLQTAVDNFDFVQISYLGDLLDDFMNDVSVSDEVAVENIFTEIKQIKDLTEEAELEETKEAMLQYGSSYVQTNEEANQDWDYSKTHNMDEVGLDNIDEFHAKMQQHGQPQKKKFDFTSPYVKEKTMGIIGELETLIQSTMEQRLNDEVESNVAASEFAYFLKSENRELTSHTAIYNRPILEAEEALAAATAKHDKCLEELKKLSDYIELLKRKQALYSTNRAAYKEKLLREMGLINEIWLIYSKGLDGVSDGLKERIDDGLANGHFAGTVHYDKRELHANYANQADDFNSVVEAKAQQVVGGSD